ncbi:GDP-mannose-dependent alpha-(1-6)-phosphatidylinositol dimannoside mannosyltransferase [Sphaerisporangium krabiense]|uniref:Alpha-1,6-mannosyltransferase n=1 Tax=Sphaerisporangium krabiense TaxID=763782 RepID=A0A7W8Z7J5_9ACTN|nr:glycosyltransferase [Sphaerisporangium krabiense]MBB5628923.1 alpha-1,6-mannosyltransferase [Sphaerisporangium krabiense]GII60236.1 GDP-mannose-dependent alpha-(1-6)-phosphatidylinositol dimannoside mannosyltransferase [Sphaerisporangium krabiense]
MRIVRLANFVAPRSGGLRTALNELGSGYRAAGHEPILVIPGPAAATRDTPAGTVITIPGPVVPGTGGYRVLTARRPLRRLLDALRPDRLEVSDRTTLRWTGRWARSRGVRSVMVSHESLDGLLRLFAPDGTPVRPLADRLNRATAADFDVVVCTTAWAAAEFRRLGVPNLVQVPLGVDLDRFHPRHRDPGPPGAPGEPLIVHCSRLSAEKRPDRPIDALAELRRRGVPARLVVAGDGPRRAALRARAAGLPVTFLGHVADRDRIARLLATADVVVAPGPVETFGLAALEALAAGTPVVVSRHGALPEVVGDAGAAVDDDPRAYADAIQDLLARDEGERRRAARRRAERYGWPAAVGGFLAAHAVPDSQGARR